MNLSLKEREKREMCICYKQQQVDDKEIRAKRRTSFHIYDYGTLKTWYTSGTRAEILIFPKAEKIYRENNEEILMKTGDIQMIRSNQGLTESPSQESVMFRVEKETKKIYFDNIFSRLK